MPRYRTISCSHCGFMQLKRDLICERCGEMTAREKRKWVARLIYAGVMIAIGLVLYARIQSVLVAGAA